MHFVVLSVYLQPEICPGVGDLSLGSIVLTTSFTASVCKKQKTMVLPSHEANVFFHSLADVLQFITSVRYKGKYI